MIANNLSKKAMRFYLMRMEMLLHGQIVEIIRKLREIQEDAKIQSSQLTVFKQAINELGILVAGQSSKTISQYTNYLASLQSVRKKLEVANFQSCQEQQSTSTQLCRFQFELRQIREQICRWEQLAKSFEFAKSCARAEQELVEQAQVQLLASMRKEITACS